jgi:hypothetical protein
MVVGDDLGDAFSPDRNPNFDLTDIRSQMRMRFEPFSTFFELVGCALDFDWVGRLDLIKGQLAAGLTITINAVLH